MEAVAAAGGDGGGDNVCVCPALMLLCVWWSAAVCRQISRLRGSRQLLLPDEWWAYAQVRGGCRSSSSSSGQEQVGCEVA